MTVGEPLVPGTLVKIALREVYRPEVPSAPDAIDGIEEPEASPDTEGGAITAGEGSVDDADIAPGAAPASPEIRSRLTHQPDFAG